jgi:hypothetical protein
LSGPALAQDSDDGPRVVFKQETEIDFEDVSVDGELQRPNGAYVVDRRETSFNPLIRLRTDFNPEMYASVDEVK